ncbi:hypothetical protein BC833DRAFT_606093 [Globomyces pollinis-pini]|nr:hypothetical protein BC833DRAFT_606093 [Globomyces pollinis-pini]
MNNNKTPVRRMLIRQYRKEMIRSTTLAEVMEKDLKGIRLSWDNMRILSSLVTALHNSDHNWHSLLGSTAKMEESQVITEKLEDQFKVVSDAFTAFRTFLLQYKTNIQTAKELSADDIQTKFKIHPKQLDLLRKTTEKEYTVVDLVSCYLKYSESSSDGITLEELCNWAQMVAIDKDCQLPIDSISRNRVLEVAFALGGTKSFQWALMDWMKRMYRTDIVPLSICTAAIEKINESGIENNGSFEGITTRINDCFGSMDDFVGSFKDMCSIENAVSLVSIFKKVPHFQAVKYWETVVMADFPTVLSFSDAMKTAQTRIQQFYIEELPAKYQSTIV